MKVFIAGASGVLGRRLIRQLTERGHSVVGQVRSARAESVVRALGGNPRHADLFDAESLAKAAAGCDTVIHAATAIPTKTQDESRRLGDERPHSAQRNAMSRRSRRENRREKHICSKALRGSRGPRMTPRSMKTLRPCRTRPFNRPSMRRRSRAKQEQWTDSRSRFCAAATFTTTNPHTHECWRTACENARCPLSARAKQRGNDSHR